MPDLSDLSLADLIERQQELTRSRLAIVAEARTVADELDRRAVEAEERRLAEAAEQGQVNKPPTQSVFGDA